MIQNLLKKIQKLKNPVKNRKILKKRKIKKRSRFLANKNNIQINFENEENKFLLKKGNKNFGEWKQILL